VPLLVSVLLGAFIGVGRRPTKRKQKEKTNLLSAPTALALSFIEMRSFFFFVCAVGTQ